ncbi:MAG: DEAD/DEAH box helicase [Sedimenticola sp.]
MTDLIPPMEKAFQLRPYQLEAVENLRKAFLRGSRRPLLQLPTGGGKMVIASEIAKLAKDKGKRVLFLAPRRELVTQAAEKFAAFGIQCGVIMAGEEAKRNLYALVQAASIDTLHARGIRTERMVMPPADMVIVDEAHLMVTKTRKELLASYPEAVIIGLTATPARGDGKGLGEIFDSLVPSLPVSKLIAEGYLSPVRYYAPSKPDLDGLKTSNTGDYVIKELGKRIDKPQLVGDVVDNWLRIARDRKTVIFCVTRSHSRHVCEALRAKGIAADHLDGDTPLEERRAILRRVETGETQVLCNVFIATFGLDIPSLECAVLARPTRNITLYLQMAGRVLRPSPETGKVEALIIDHAGAVDEHGFIDDPIPWSLDPSRKVKDLKEERQREKAEPKEITCGDCGTVFKGTRICPECGHEMIPPGKPIPTYQAELKELKARNRKTTKPQKARFHGELKWIQKKRGYKSGWASNQYRQKFGVWPNDPEIRYSLEHEPSQETLNWVKSRQIAYSKRRDVA